MNKLNDLTTSLLAIGIGLIVLVILFNWWQERKIRKAAEKQFSKPQDDLLMNGVEFADALDPFEESAVLIESSTKIKDVVDRYDASDVHLPDEVEFKIDLSGSDIDDELTEKVISEDPPLEGLSDGLSPELDRELLIENEVSNVTTISTNALPDRVSRDVDLVALFFLPNQVSGERLRQFLIELVNLDKPVFAYGFDAAQTWHSLTIEQSSFEFNKAVFSLQLADRAGPVSHDTLERFKQVVSEIAYELSAQVEWIGPHDPLTFARELDAFCLEVDQTVGFHLVNGAGGRFTGTKFRGLAETHQLYLKDDGGFYAHSPSGQAVFKLVNMENNPFTMDMLKSVALKGVSFQMEIALAENCTETFNSMVLIAKSMASALSATLVDDHQRELSDVKIEKIRQQLRLIQVQMTVKGIPPGSPVALRLFV